VKRSTIEALDYRPKVPVTAERLASDNQRNRRVAERGMVVLNLQSDRHSETPIDIFVKEPFDFDAEYAAALVVEIAPGVQSRTVGLKALIRLKQQAGRPQDLADVAELRSIHGGPRE